MVKIIIPLIAEGLYIASTFVWPEHILYSMLIFYAFLTVWFIRDFHIREMFGCMKSFKGFWLPSICCGAGMIGAYFLANRLIPLIISDGTGTMTIWTNNEREYVILAFLNIILIPASSELFYRQGLISYRDNRTLAATTVASVLLCAVTHATGPWGIMQMAILTLPSTICYLITWNIYPAMLVNFVYAIIMNLPNLIYVTARFVTR